MRRSTTPPEELKPRKRRFNPKVRTGCKTCRARRVKCGEEKPCCKRCISAGRVCDGYETIRLAQASTSSDGQLTMKWIRPTSQPPDTTIEEQSVFHHFREHVLDSLAGPFEPGVWHRDVLSISMTEPAVRNAVIALGALGHHDDSGGGDAFALKHYSMAMRALHEKIPECGPAATQLTLTTCLLFVAFELQKSGYTEAKYHLDGGLSIIREAQQERTSHLQDPTESLVEAFQRLDIQMSLFTSSRVHLNRLSEYTVTSRIATEVMFHDITGAHRHLNLQMASMRELVHAANEARFAPEGMCAQQHEAFERHLIQQLVGLRTWEMAMIELRNQLSRPRDLQAARILQIHHICCILMVSTSLTNGREKHWDDYTTDFERILALAEEVQAIMPTTQEGEKCRHSFKLDMGIIPPLYFTAMKCRDPMHRRRAVKILTNTQFQEGAFHGPTMAQLAQSIILVEEKGLWEPRTAADIPEENRLFQAYYDLTDSDKLLWCKRRCFEQDGQWVDYFEHLG